MSSQTKFCPGSRPPGPSFFSNYLSQPSHFPLKILKGLNRIIPEDAGSFRERREVRDIGENGGKEVRPHWASRRRKKIIPRFLYILGRRQTKIDNECQLSRPAEKHFKKKKHQRFIKNTLALRASEEQRWWEVKWYVFEKKKNNKKGLMRSPRTQDNQMESQTAPLKKGTQGPNFCWGGRRFIETLSVRMAALATVTAHLQLLRNSVAYSDYSVFNSYYKQRAEYHLRWYLKSCSLQTVCRGLQGAGCQR